MLIFDDAAILEDGLGKVVVLGDPSGTKNSNEPVGDMARNVTSPQETLELHQTGGRGGTSSSLPATSSLQNG